MIKKWYQNIVSQNTNDSLKISKYINKKYFNKKVNNFFENNFHKISSIILFKKNKVNIIYGAVQSGKTKYIIRLAFEAILKDYYDCVFYLSGRNNNLHKQNYDDFTEYKRESRIKKNITILNETKNCCSIFKNSIILYKKIINNINVIQNMINCSSCIKKYKRILIIDDECDDASLDKRNKNTKINEAIVSFIYSSNIVKYVGISGTPFFNLSLQNQPKPENVLILDDDPNYQGLNFYSNRKFYHKISTTKKFQADKIIKIVEKFLKENKNQNKAQLLISIKTGISDNRMIKKMIQDLIDNEHFGKIELQKPKVVQWSAEQINNKYAPDYSINIGNLILGRGLRLNYLTHVLIDSTVKSYNPATYIQKARWFGYNKNIKKIYTTNSMINFYTKIAPKFDSFVRNLFYDDPVVTPEKVSKINKYIKNEKELKLKKL